MIAGLLILPLAMLGMVAPAAAMTTPVVAQTTKETVSPADPDQQIKCRKSIATGSLVRKVKMCRTIAEWRKAAQAGNDAARAIAGENICSGGECRGFEPPAGAP
jgi:hypothetical protein